MTGFINFRNCNATTRLKMKLRNPAAVQELKIAEERTSGGIWFRKKDFPGACDHMESERPKGEGQLFRFG